MKKIFIVLGLISLIATSCNEDEFLNPENRNQLNAENFWLNERDAEAGILSVYSTLQFSGNMGGNAMVVYNLLSEAGRVGNVNRAPQRLQIDNALVNNTNGNVEDLWEDGYKTVFRANQVIANVPDIDMDETAKREILGEAYFLRGLAMFWISTMFNEGSVPYPLIAPGNLEEARFPLEDKAFVTNQIEQDLLKAQTNLEDRLNWTAERQQGRATYGAATAILGKFYLYEENFTRAAEELKRVIDLGEYSLASNIRDNFNEEGEFNPESIFEVQYFANLVDDDGNFGDGEGGQPDESTLRAHLHTRGNGGVGYVFATHFISSLYRNEVVDQNINQMPEIRYNEIYDPALSDDDNKYNILELPRTKSLRMEASIFYEDDGSLFFGNSINAGFIRVISRAQIKKFSNTDTSESEPVSSSINERIIRLADVYLMYAEALLRGQGDAALPEALEFINRVRQRSGLVTLEELFNGVPIPPVIRNTFPELNVGLFTAELANLNAETAEISAEASVLQGELNDLNALPDPTEAQLDRIGEINDRIAAIAVRTGQIQLRIAEINIGERIPEIEAEILEIVPQLPSVLTIEPQALNATNVVAHLFNKERPAEFAWEGRAILWHDLRRRPAEIGNAVERIQELGNTSYQPVMLDVLNFETLPDQIENRLQDFQFRKVNFDQNDFSFPIPASEIIQNPLIN